MLKSAVTGVTGLVVVNTATGLMLDLAWLPVVAFTLVSVLILTGTLAWFDYSSTAPVNTAIRVLLENEAGDQTSNISDADSSNQDQPRRMVDVIDKIRARIEHHDSTASNLSGTSSKSAISAAEVSFSVSELRGRLEQQVDEMRQVAASNAEITRIGQQVFRIAETGARDIQRCFENAIADGEISEIDPFDRDYRQIEGSNPPKYHTRFDQFTDRVVPNIQETILQENGFLAFAIATDNRGYVPTHNDRFCQPLTGDFDKGLVGNRSKQIFDDETGARCGSHTQRLLLQTYKRDTGEIMHDLSVPLYVNGKHWGGFRIGYFS